VTPLVVVALLVLSSSLADARPRPRPGGRFEANKTFGLGIMLGAPTAISGKLFVGADTAIDFGVGVYYRYRDRDGLHLHGDFLWHPVVLAKTETFWLPLYFGVGARFLDLNDNRGNAIGVRVPLGIDFDFETVPLDVFLEVAVILDVIVDNGYDRGDFGGAVGIRYWF